MEKQINDSSERVYALDAMRAIMMLLGIVIHSSITYASIGDETAWPLNDPNNSLVFDIVVVLIHSFRMPVFFVSAGYFGALLFYKKGPKAMMINRVKRILLPFLLGVLIIYPCVFFAFKYSMAAFNDVLSPFNNALNLIFFWKIYSFQYHPFMVFIFSDDVCYSWGG